MFPPWLVVGRLAPVLFIILNLVVGCWCFVAWQFVVNILGWNLVVQVGWCLIVQVWQKTLHTWKREDETPPEKVISRALIDSY